MKIHPDIAALRSDPLSQRRIADRMRLAKRHWQEAPMTAQALEDLERFGAGHPIADCPTLLSMVNNHALAEEVTGLWMNSLIEALRDESLGEVPFLFRNSAGFSSMRIAQSGTAAINLLAYERVSDATNAEPQSAIFVDRESIEVVLQGSASATFYSLSKRSGRNPVINSRPLKLSPGETVLLSGYDESRQITSVDGMMVMLQISRVPERAAPSLEYRLSDGALIKTVSGDKSASQRLIALSVLGELDRGGLRSHEVMKSCALDQSEDIDVRWEAVRQMLAADTQTGWALLNDLADDAGDALSASARKLREQLMVQSPALAQLHKDAA